MAGERGGAGMRGWKLGWKVLWPVLWYLGVMGAAALLCPRRFSVLEVAGVAAGAAAVTLLLGGRLYRGRDFWENLGSGGKALGYGWLLIPAGIAVCIMLNGLLILLGLESTSGMYDGRAEMIYASRMWEQLLISCVLIPFAEELVFRELGFGRLRKECGPALAAGIIAVLFGIYHLQLVQGLYALCLGLLLAAAYEKCGGLGAAFLVHAVSNLTAVVLSLEGEKSWLWGKSLFVVSATLISGLILILCVRKMLKTEGTETKTLLQ